MKRALLPCALFATALVAAASPGVAEASPASGVPAAVDWVAAGKVGPVPNQGQCGSDFAFSAAGAIASAAAIADGKAPVPLSAQQLMDCSESYGNEGCGGGLMDYAFEYVIANKGLSSAAAYPYTAKNGTCQHKPSAATIVNYTDVLASGGDPALISAVAKGPVAAAVDADQAAFQFYSGGILKDPSCGTHPNHAVLIVGYDYTKKYWKIQNFWGPTWGQGGYALLAMGRDQCGINLGASYPTGVH